MIRFARSTQLLWCGKGSGKLWRWINLCSVSLGRYRRILDFDVRYLDAASLRHLYHELFAREEYLFSCEKENPAVFDCGANIGMAALFFKWLYPESRITAFEPDPVTFRVLRENVEENHLHDVSLHNVALWSESGTVSFYVAQDRPGSLTMSANPSRMKERKSQCQVGGFPITSTAQLIS